jgi:hypothetical protein
LKRVKRHFSKLWDAIDDWPANRDPLTIVHELDEAGDRELLVMTLAAVSEARSGPTPASPWGFKGSMCCSRSNP